jgi:hypothetical protein
MWFLHTYFIFGIERTYYPLKLLVHTGIFKDIPERFLD